VRSRDAVLKGLGALESATPERALEAVRPFMERKFPRYWVMLAGVIALVAAGFVYLHFFSSTSKLEGTVYSETGSLLPEVTVRLPELNLRTKTNQFGRFAFAVPGKGEHTVKLIAEKPCYETRNFDPMLGDTRYEFKLFKDHRCAS